MIEVIQRLFEWEEPHMDLALYTGFKLKSDLNFKENALLAAVRGCMSNPFYSNNIAKIYNNGNTILDTDINGYLQLMTTPNYKLNIFFHHLDFYASMGTRL